MKRNTCLSRAILILGCLGLDGTALAQSDDAVAQRLRASETADAAYFQCLEQAKSAENPGNLYERTPEQVKRSERYYRHVDQCIKANGLSHIIEGSASEGSSRPDNVEHDADGNIIFETLPAAVQAQKPSADVARDVEPVAPAVPPVIEPAAPETAPAPRPALPGVYNIQKPKTEEDGGGGTFTPQWVPGKR